MREIIFRGKRLDNGAWIYSDLVNANEMRTGARRVEIWVPQPDGECDPENLEYGVVDPNTVGQYTGLLDKNGTKVFEGDIILIYKIDDVTRLERVVFEMGCFYGKENIPAGYNLKPLEAYCYAHGPVMEVVGNIYD